MAKFNCYVRVSKTYTALMINEVAINYINKLSTKRTTTVSERKEETVNRPRHFGRFVSIKLEHVVKIQAEEELAVHGNQMGN